MRTVSKRRRPAFWPIAALIAIALGCAAGAGMRLKQAAMAERDIELLRERSGRTAIVYIRPAGVPVPAGAPAAPRPTPEPPEPAALRVAALQRENPELVGWLTMEAAGVDYPVMQSPARANFYIDHDFEGKDSKSGLPYIDERCAPEGVNRIVYGHNMKNGTMFGQLKRYLDADFYAENAAFTYDTVHGREHYRVIAVYETTIDESAAFRFYTYTDIEDADRYWEYTANVIARSVHEAPPMPNWGRKLLTLVTCVRYRPNDRLVIVAAEVE